MPPSPSVLSWIFMISKLPPQSAHLKSSLKTFSSSLLGSFISFSPKYKTIDKGGSMMLSLKNTKNANSLFIVDMLKGLLSQELITEKEYDRAKKYYRKLTGADIVLAQ